VGRRACDAPSSRRAGATTGAKAMGANRRGYRDGRISVHQRLLDWHVLPASGHFDAAGGLRGELGALTGPLVMEGAVPSSQAGLR